MKLLFLTFYYQPDLCAGSFRATSLSEELIGKEGLEVDIITTQPNRYSTFKAESKDFEKIGNLNIYRIALPSHESGMIDQAKSFITFFYKTLKIIRKKKYDLIFATSSRLFTAFLGAFISKIKRVPLYLDVRDIFYDTMKDILKKSSIKIVLPIIKSIEIFTFKSANKINIVSRGFEKYFHKINPNLQLSYFTNGIDSVFLNYDFTCTKKNTDKIIITYAGNIGKGQGLDKIVPQMAAILGQDYLIKIVGDGGAKKELKQKLKKMPQNNIELLDPINRTELLKIYKESDYLFLHLNKLKAFEKVLPSKIFEYAVTGKTIIAGVEGFSKLFIKKNIPNAIIFEPANIDSFIKEFNKKRNTFDITAFKNKYNRKTISSKMATDILQTK